MKHLLLALSVMALCVGSALAAPPAQSIPDNLQDISVTIRSGDSQGSGTIVTRKIGDDSVSFIWTAAHVVDNLRMVRKIITADGGTRVLVEFKDAQIVQEFRQRGRRVGETTLEAKVIKFSDADYGEDLALLMVRRLNAYPLSTTAKFMADSNYVPAIGVELSHCGSLLGQFGANSYTTGVLSQVGRTLEMKGANVKVFDQVTAVAFPGSSGGGMYLKENGQYIGMLTQGVMKLQGFNFIVPVRRIHGWAKASKIEWAVDPAVPMPTLADMEKMPVEDQGALPSGLPASERAAPVKAGKGFHFDDARNYVEEFRYWLRGRTDRFFGRSVTK
jgi:Trypsin-like peptidase domain